MHWTAAASLSLAVLSLAAQSGSAIASARAILVGIVQCMVGSAGWASSHYRHRESHSPSQGSIPSASKS